MASKPLALGDLHHRPPPPRDEHTGRRVAQPLVDQIGRGRTRVTVVDTHVADATAARHIGDKRDHRDAFGGEPVDRLGHQVGVGGLHDHPVRAAGSDLVQGFHHRRHRPGFAEMEAAADHRGCQRGQLGLHRSLECARKPLRRLHDNIDQILAPGQPLCRTRSTVASLNPAC